MTFILLGGAFGLAGGLVPGPLTALVIAQTLRFSRLEGYKVSLAPVITDGPLLFISLFLAHQAQSIAMLTAGISLGGVLVLIWLALDTWRASAPSINTGRVAESNIGGANSLKKSVLTNLLNPHPYLFWITVGGPTASKALMAGTLHLVGFVASFAIAIVGSKMVIATAIDHYREQFQGRVYQLTLKGLALALLAIAGQFAFDAWTAFSGLN